jgi:hypothetical protein
MTKEQLKRIRLSDKRIDNKLDQIERLRSLAERTTAVITGMPRSGGQQDRYNAIICRVWALEKEVVEDIDNFVDMVRAAKSEIESLPDEQEKTVLEARYFAIVHGSALQAIWNCPKRPFTTFTDEP